MRKPEARKTARKTGEIQVKGPVQHIPYQFLEKALRVQSYILRLNWLAASSSLKFNLKFSFALWLWFSNALSFRGPKATNVRTSLELRHWPAIQLLSLHVHLNNLSHDVWLSDPQGDEEAPWASAPAGDQSLRFCRGLNCTQKKV